MVRTLVATAISVATVAALCTAFVLANFGAARGWFVLLLVIPLTLGLPTTLAALATVSLWDGPPLWGFLLTCVACGVVAQRLTAIGLRRLVSSRARSRVR